MRVVKLAASAVMHGAFTAGQQVAFLPPVFRQTRAAWRLSLIALHLAWGCGVVALTFRWRNVHSQRRAKRIWSRQLLRRLGIRLEDSGALPDCGVLVVANHVSWIDIFVINALRACAFVCKDDVRHWPVIGWLTASTETIFIQRGSRAAARRTAEEVAEALRQDGAIVAFPEGTTTNGTELLPFRPAMLQAAIDAQVPLVPVAIRYRDRGNAISPAPTYDGDISLMQCLRAITLADDLVAVATVLPAIDAPTARRHLADAAHASIAGELGFEVTAEASADAEGNERV
ncbi:lysophospholipid acyltransferase family protein [Niveibacterium sp. SC-1]|uniref:lysophospholipid acyltransferase family protein n=1 Tax=Niveibacterium sp. SC-1 TaxID=3135646 RepID=UPI0031200B0F